MPTPRQRRDPLSMGQTPLNLALIERGRPPLARRTAAARSPLAAGAETGKETLAAILSRLFEGPSGEMEAVSAPAIGPGTAGATIAAVLRNPAAFLTKLRKLIAAGKQASAVKAVANLKRAAEVTGKTSRAQQVINQADNIVRTVGAAAKPTAAAAPVAGKGFMATVGSALKKTGRGAKAVGRVPGVKPFVGGGAAVAGWMAVEKAIEKGSELWSAAPDPTATGVREAKAAVGAAAEAGKAVVALTQKERGKRIRESLIGAAGAEAETYTASLMIQAQQRALNELAGKIQQAKSVSPQTDTPTILRTLMGRAPVMGELYGGETDPDKAAEVLYMTELGQALSSAEFQTISRTLSESGPPGEPAPEFAGQDAGAAP